MNPVLKAAVLANAILLVSCGTPEAQGVRRVLLHDDGGSPDQESGSTNERPFAAMAGTIRFGLHAPRGWTRVPIVLGLQVGTPAERGVAIQRAADTWNDAVGFPLLVFGSDIPAHGTALYDRLDDRQNSLAFLPKWCVTGKDPRVLASAIWDNPDADTSVIETGDIVFNEEHYNLTDAMTAEASDKREIVDLESLALHELGHLLGLAHAFYEGYGGIMSPSLFIGSRVTHRVLHPDDIARVRSIYVPGAPPPPPDPWMDRSTAAPNTNPWPAGPQPNAPDCN